MATFDHPWFAEIIERFDCDTEGREINVSLDGLGRNLIAAACIIAQSIDAHAKALESVARAIRDSAEGER